MGQISEACYNISIPSALLTSDFYTIRLGEFSAINSIYKINAGDYFTLSYGATEKTLTITSANEGVYDNIDEYVALIQEEMPELFT